MSALILDELKKVALNDVANYGKFYFDNVESIFDYLKNFSGVKSEISIQDFNKEMDYIRFSSILSDISSVYLKYLGKGVKITLVDKQKITASNQLFNTIIKDNNNPVIFAGYSLREQNELSDFFKMVKPLLKSNRLILHSERVMMGKTSDNRWQAHDVFQGSPLNNWVVDERLYKEINSIPIEFNPVSYQNKKELFEITIPYLKGIPIKELNIVLNDNADLLSSFRKNLKELISQGIKDNKTLDEIKNDLVRPDIDKLNSKFTSIKNIHKLKVAGTTLSCITTTLLSLPYPELTKQIFITLSTLGLGAFVKNEVDYQKELEKLKDYPLFLLWQVKKIQE